MPDLMKEIGEKINFSRKKKDLSLQEMSDLIHKSKSTISKYENGQIDIDIVTLYDIAKALDIEIDQLLYTEPMREKKNISSGVPSFFKGLTQFYVYYYDGRDNTIDRCVVDVISSNAPNDYNIMMYMNIESYEHYQNCENTYHGSLKHFDALSTLRLENRDTPMEQITINILASYLDSPIKFGLFCGISSRPMMPVSTKVLIAKKVQKETDEFIQSLKISKDDIKRIRLYNMFPVT
jgi:transcriptional regulator with XRE-family HTH domain